MTDLTHPQPGFYETTVVMVDGRRIDHTVVEEIRDRPSWNFADANRRAMVKINTRRLPSAFDPPSSSKRTRKRAPRIPAPREPSE